MIRCSGDDTFGPVLGPESDGCYNFDFTLVFEESIFSIVPCAIVLPLAAVRLYFLLRRPVSVRWQLLQAAKLVCRSSIWVSLLDIKAHRTGYRLPMSHKLPCNLRWRCYGVQGEVWSHARLSQALYWRSSRRYVCWFYPSLNMVDLFGPQRYFSFSIS